MLKGQRVLTSQYFGTVLNNAENEKVLILHVIRKRQVRHNSQDPISVILNVPPTESWWEACDEEVIVPWSLAGETKISPHLPTWLHLRVLKRRRFSGGHFTTTVKGKTYIDW